MALISKTYCGNLKIEKPLNRNFQLRGDKGDTKFMLMTLERNEKNVIHCLVINKTFTIDFRLCLDHCFQIIRADVFEQTQGNR